METLPTCQGHWMVSNPQRGLLQGNAPCKHPVLGDSSRLARIYEAAKLFRTAGSRVQIKDTNFAISEAKSPSKHRYVVKIRHIACTAEGGGGILSLLSEVC